MNSAIFLEDIKKTLGGREVLRSIGFSVEKGDIFGYLGPNGAGKTTTIRILLGLLLADAGRLEIMGSDINLGRTRRNVGFILDPDGLYDNMTAEENLEFYGCIYGVSGVAGRISKLLHAVGLVGRETDRVGTYSRGMRQRLALARAMVHNPEVLILDEPTAGVDPSGQIEIRQIMLDLAGREDKTVFLSSHNLDEVQRICNRIALIDRGELKLYGELESLRQGMGGGMVIIKFSGNMPQQVLDDLQGMHQLGFREKTGSQLLFSPGEGAGVADIIQVLSTHGIRIEGASRQEASLEEMYSAILKEAERI
jgi:ABC-2 type transport system ATP-binding protein